MSQRNAHRAWEHVAPSLIIGDVHGCIDELRRLLDAHGAGRRWILTGDLVAKGPASDAVVRLAREQDALAVRGNHDHRVIRWRQDVQAGRDPHPLGDDHLDVARSLSAEDWRWLSALPYRIVLPDSSTWVVHGGFVPGIAPEAQEPEWMLTLRSIRPDGAPSKRVDDGVPWASCWRGPDAVFFGHDAIRGLQRHPYAIGLDTGCVYGGALSGFLLPEGELVQVAAQRRWAPKRSE